MNSSLKPIPIFATPIWKGTFVPEDAEFFEKCKRLAFDLKTRDPAGVVKSNQGGWQSKSVSVEHVKQSPVMPFFDYMLDLMSTVNYDLGIKCSEKCWTFGNTWININFNGNKNIPHIHPRADLSGVLYLTDNNSTITFYRDDSMHDWGMSLFDPMEFKPIFNNRIYKIKPEKGDFLIFYPWLRHSVEENNTDEARISLAFNLRFYNSDDSL